MSYNPQSLKFDGNSQNYNAGNRDYDPSLGRWTTPDPLGYPDGGSRYQFVGSGPVDMLDPGGLSAAAVFAGIAEGVGFTGALPAAIVTAGAYSVYRIYTDTGPLPASFPSASSGVSTSSQWAIAPSSMAGAYAQQKAAGDAMIKKDQAQASSQSASQSTANVQSQQATDAARSTCPTTRPSGPTTQPARFPNNPDDLLSQGYRETSHPDAKAAGHRTFENPATGDTVRFDKGKPGAPGWEGEDHYHQDNPASTGKKDQYLALQR